MTEEEKKTLVDAVNCKYPHQNLTEIYYNIGRALPFTAQRFPDGRVSDWYRNQYVEVVRVEPHGRGGKFGNVFGFYYRNGERADAYENDPEHSWCTKNDTEPQPIPCCGCGSWMLLDIIKDWQYVKWAIIDSQHLYTDVDKVLEYHMENRPTLGPNDIMSFGKYKGKSIEEVYKTDRQYLIWLSQNNDSFNLDWEKFK